MIFLMDVILIPLLQVICTLLGFYSTGLAVYGFLMMLESFGMVNSYNIIVYRIHNALFVIYNPALEKIREAFDFGPIDLSVIILYLGVFFLRQVLIRFIDLF